MAKRFLKGCTHCFHVVSSCTDGMGVSGWDDEMCCHCGGGRRRWWTWRQHPDHGSHVTVNERIYEVK